MIKKRWLLGAFGILLLIVCGGLTIRIVAVPGERAVPSIGAGTYSGSQAKTSLAPNAPVPDGSGSADFASSAPPDADVQATIGATAATIGMTQAGVLIALQRAGNQPADLSAANSPAGQTSGDMKTDASPPERKVPDADRSAGSPTPWAPSPAPPYANYANTASGSGSTASGSPRPLDQVIALSDPARKTAPSASAVTPASGAGQVVTITPRSEAESLTAEEKVLAEAVSAQARKADVVIEVPKSMEVGTSYVARLIVSRAKASSVTSVDPAKVVFDNTFPVAVNVKASATSPTMTVKAADPPEKVLLANVPAIWSWKVDPVAEKEAILTISLEHRITLPSGKEVYLPVGPFPQTIAINVGLFARFSGWTDQFGIIEKLAVAITTALGAVMGLIVAVRGLWPKKAVPNSPPRSG